MSPKLRVCIQWPRFGPYHMGRLQAVHERLAADGMELVALETASKDALYAWSEMEATTDFQRVQVFPGQVFESIPPAVMHAEVVSALDRMDPDIVFIHTYSFPDSRACLEWCKKRNRSAVVMTDSKEDDAPRNGFREWLKSGLIQSYDAALLGGTPQRRYFEKLGFPPDGIFLGYDVVDNAYFRQAAEKSKASDLSGLPGLGPGDGPDHAPFFLASNRFIPAKNLDRLLMAYSAYRRLSDNPWRLIMLGDGELRPQLEAAAPDGVVFAGFRQIEDIPAYYGAAACFIHPCLKDTWALVVNEAMACGLPVLVSTRAGCHVDLVEHGENGYRFDPEDVGTMTSLMMRVAEHTDWRKRAGRRSLEIIAEWDLDRFVSGVYDAMVYCKETPRVPYHARGRAIVALMKRTRSTTAFHTAEI
ncbi:MAG: glycosyltransferase family 4 protein [Rhodothermales bacterium]